MVDDTINIFVIIQIFVIGIVKFTIYRKAIAMFSFTDTRVNVLNTSLEKIL